MVKKNKLYIGAVLSLMAFGAQAESSVSVETEPTGIVKKAELKSNEPGMIGLITKSGMTVENKFKVSDDITGYVLKKGPEHSLVYSVGSHVFAGVLFDDKGVNVSRIYQDKYIPQPNVNDAVADIEKLGVYVEEGTSKKEVYVFVDPSCPHCHDYYKATRNAVKNGEITIKWVTVGFLSPQSRDKAAYILSAEDKVKAMQDVELGYNVPKAKNAQLRQVAINQELMQKAGVRGTPGVLYKKNGQWVMAKGGMDPKKLAQFVE